jgi:beta-glucosidase
MSSESPKAFIDADLDAIISQLTIEEKAGLLCAADHWHTRSVPRLNVPSIKVTDGPNGARGGSQLRMTPALCLPCGTALGATFDTALIQEVGEVLADETKARSACVLLGPTVPARRQSL